MTHPSYRPYSDRVSDLHGPGLRANKVRNSYDIFFEGSVPRGILAASTTAHICEVR